MLFPADKRMIELTKEVIAAAALGYTEDQRAEIPAAATRTSQKR